MSEKRYQVFVSSTYVDLQEELAVVAQTLPSLGCLPCGLEPHAANASTWAAAKKLIDQSDYYLMVSGSRYGTLSPSGVSYTHMEYVYAATKKKPILVLMHEAPTARAPDLQEKTPEARRQLNDFRQLLAKGFVASWGDAANLDAALRQYLPQLIKSNPMPGWVRADDFSSAAVAQENELLKQKVVALEQEREHWLEQSKASVPLASGADKIEIQYRCKAYAAGNCEEVRVSTQISWNDIFSSFAPYLNQVQHEDFLAAKIAERLQETSLKEVQITRPKTHAITDIVMAPLAFNTIKNQFILLKLMRRVPRENDARVWWQLTAVGEQYLASLLAVRKAPVARPA